MSTIYVYLVVDKQSNTIIGTFERFKEARDYQKKYWKQHSHASRLPTNRVNIVKYELNKTINDQNPLGEIIHKGQWLR